MINYMINQMILLINVNEPLFLISDTSIGDSNHIVRLKFKDGQKNLFKIVRRKKKYHFTVQNDRV